MNHIIKKTLALILCLVILFGIVAEVSAGWVKGYWRGSTYVEPYYRSRPNAYKFDNYGYKPSQGLYNKSYYSPTRNYGSKWYTPSYYDPDYYYGKSIYESRRSYRSDYLSNYKSYSPSYRSYRLSPLWDW